MKYGELPHYVDTIHLECKEMMFYQYLPIKMAGTTTMYIEDRIKCFQPLIYRASFDFTVNFGHHRHAKSFIYLTAKYLFQDYCCPFNRPGWHCDGFLTNDINYIWSDTEPTIFNSSDFMLSEDDKISLIEMDQQANPELNKQYENNSLLRLNQYNVHRLSDTQRGMRTFFKLSFSTDKYDLEGNSHNHLIDYNWQMKKRSIERNVPQTIIK